MPSRFALGSSRTDGTTRRVPCGGSHGSTPGFAASSSTYPTCSAGARSISVSSARASWKRSFPTRSGDGGGSSRKCREVGGCAWLHASAARAAKRALRADLDRRPVIDELPDLVHLVVGDGDTSIGPVVGAMRVGDPALPVGQAMDH